MNDQIILSQGDNGIPFEIQLKNKDKENISIGTDTITVYIIKPDATIKTITEITVTDNINGVFEFVLTENETDLEGLYSVYVKISNTGYDITTNEVVTYYVVPDLGGA